ncbi:MAG: sulfite exporter TauE/SafE family protein [Cyclobacteriaceae bacterium]|nr:sulfite exporter TauE/SafE family protein [Cyclobacteriaceae bacterium]
METQELLGYFASALIGIALGLIGGGGSILTVPVLVYLFAIEPTLATAYSLFIVGITALVGGIRSALNNQVDLRTAVVFAVPSFIAVYLTRRFIIPAVPDVLFSIGSLMISRDMAIMVFFALIMLAAAYSMIADKRLDQEDSVIKYNYPMIALEGTVVGVLTGIVGAGGGFLIIPALVLLAKLPMKKAVGTSLLIIAAKSLIGFLGDVGSGQTINFTFLFIVSAIAIAGIFIGIYMSRFISGSNLKKGFGWFVVAMASYILLSEFL